MSVNCRFVLDEKRYVIDTVNVANSGKGYCRIGDPEDDKHLRERVLSTRVHGMIEKLFIIKEPNQKLPWDEKHAVLSIWHAVLCAIRASHLNTFDPTMSIQHSSMANSDAGRTARNISRHCRSFATTLRLPYATYMATSIARQWTASWTLCTLSFMASQNMWAQTSGKNNEMPRGLT